MQDNTMYLLIHTSTVNIFKKHLKKKIRIRNNHLQKEGHIFRAGDKEGCKCVSNVLFLMLHSRYRDIHLYLSSV